MRRGVLSPGTGLAVAVSLALLAGCGEADVPMLAPLPTRPVEAPTTAPPATVDVPAPTTTTTEVDTDDPDRVLIEHGDRGDDVLDLQNLLVAAGFDVNLNGLYAATTVSAVKDAQVRFGFVPTGKVTRRFLDALEQAVGADASGAETLAGAACAVGIVGDSLIDGDEDIHRQALTDATGCAGLIDGLASRTVYDGWQCWIRADDGQPKLRLVRERIDGSDCRPAGITVLRQWAELERPLDVVVVALGTNDALVFDLATQLAHLDAARTVISGDAPKLVVVTATARPGSVQAAWYTEQSAQLRAWCAAKPGCAVADWAAQPAAADPASYVDLFHLNAAAVEARARLIAQTAALLLAPPAPPTPSA